MYQFKKKFFSIVFAFTLASMTYLKKTLFFVILTGMIFSPIYLPSASISSSMGIEDKVIARIRGRNPGGHYHSHHALGNRFYEHHHRHGNYGIYPHRHGNYGSNPQHSFVRHHGRHYLHGGYHYFDQGFGWDDLGGINYNYPYYNLGYFDYPFYDNYYSIPLYYFNNDYYYSIPSYYYTFYPSNIYYPTAIYYYEDDVEPASEYYYVPYYY